MTARLLPLKDTVLQLPLACAYTAMLRDNVEATNLEHPLEATQGARSCASYC